MPHPYTVLERYMWTDPEGRKRGPFSLITKGEEYVKWWAHYIPASDVFLLLESFKEVSARLRFDPQILLSSDPPPHIQEEIARDRERLYTCVMAWRKYKLIQAVANRLGVE